MKLQSVSENKTENALGGKIGQFPNPTWIIDTAYQKTFRSAPYFILTALDVIVTYILLF